MNIHSLRDGINMKDTILKKKVSPSAGVGVGQWSDPLHSQIFELPPPHPYFLLCTLFQTGILTKNRT